MRIFCGRYLKNQNESGIIQSVCKKVIYIENNFVGAAVALLIGIGIAALNYGLSRWCLKKSPERYAMLQPLRSLSQIGYLALILLFGKYTPWDQMWLLVGGVLGITLPMPIFTYRLVKLNDARRKEEDQNG